MNTRIFHWARFVPFLVILALITSVTPASAANELGEIIQRRDLMYSVVEVHTLSVQSLVPEAVKETGAVAVGMPYARSFGTGILFSKEGYVVTNAHVIVHESEPAGSWLADNIRIVFQDGSKFPAEIIGYDIPTDIAVLRIIGDREFTSITWGDSDKLREGDPVFAIGSPYGLDGTVTKGIISAIHRKRGGPYDDFLQTDAAVNRGNSGGPLFDATGDVIGINSRVQGRDGIAFAIPSNLAVEITEKLIAKGRLQRAFLGIAIDTLTPDMAESLGAQRLVSLSHEGVYVAEVLKNAPAGAAFKAGDIILSAEGQSIRNNSHFLNIVANTEQASIVATVWRDGKEVQVTATAGERESPRARVREVDTTIVANSALPDIVLFDLTPELRLLFRLDDDFKGVMVTYVDPRSQAAMNGVLKTDLITSVSLAPVASIVDIETEVEAARSQGREHVLLSVFKLATGGNRNIAVQLK